MLFTSGIVLLKYYTYAFIEYQYFFEKTKKNPKKDLLFFAMFGIISRRSNGELFMS